MRATIHPDTLDEPTWDTRLLWASLFASLAVFAKVPNLDLWVSERYFATGEGFVGASLPWVAWLHQYVPGIGYSLMAAAALFLVLLPWFKRMAASGKHLSMATLLHAKRSAVAGLLAAGLCSGLIVHAVLKEFVGRPRPVETVAFGGSAPFVPVFQRGDHPNLHKSFVSGHATTAFLLMGLGLVCRPRWRLRWLLIGSVAGSLVGLARVMQGAHYLGDVVFAFHAVWLSCEVVAWFMARPVINRWLQ
jgi:lipid A 4'-phosphatase